MSPEKKPHSEPYKIFYYQGKNSIPNPETAFKQKVKELCNVKHINFLFGAGTSADAIPTMDQMKKKLDGKIKEQDNELIKVYESITQENLEGLLSVLYAKRFDLESSTTQDDLETVGKLITYVQNFMFNEINVTTESNDAKKALGLYNDFYSKLALRNKDLSRVNVFTTNNDLFNERSLDYLNINYNNGFGGGLEKYFNPARFRYTYSKKVDLNMEKFEPLDNMLYLYKLHGSINWREKKGNSLFNIEEIPIKAGDKASDNPALIFPTPLKQNQSLGAPYTDLIREFQAKLMLPNSVLFVIGYSFSDEHLNSVIYQALASNTAISIVVFGNPECTLSKIDDSRVYRFYGSVKNGQAKDVNVHFFEYIVNHIFPDVDENKDKTLLESFVEQLAEASNQNSA